MQIKNSVLLVTALTASSAAARLHGHERRHAHPERRGVGDMVYATMGGKVVSWINEWTGHATTSADDAQATASSDATNAIPNAPAQPTDAPAPKSSDDDEDKDEDKDEDEDKPSAKELTKGSCKDWLCSKNAGDYTRDGFGEATKNNDLSYIFYTGNVGKPWGSNIQEVDKSRACEYEHVVRFDGSEEDPWTITFWNKMGPDGKLTGWFGHSALTIRIQPGETKYVAFDSDSQGAWGAAKGNTLPVNHWGAYACTWGEFDFGNNGNEGWVGWDVSAIEVMKTTKEVQGMKICNHDGKGCSSISNLGKKVENAYTDKEEGVDGIGGRHPPGPARLLVNIDYE